MPATPSETPLPDDLIVASHRAAILALASSIGMAMVMAIATGSLVWTIVGATTIAIVGGIKIRGRSLERAEHLRSTLEAYRQETGQWQQRWMKLQLEAQQTTSALQKMRDGVILLSQSGDILLINPSARKLLAIPVDSEIEGRRLGEVVRIPEISRAIGAAGDGKGTQKFQLEIQTEDVLRPINVRVDPIESRLELKLLVSLRDETETNRVDEMRREFVANISHELKTPLAAIKGYAETVELAIEDDPTAAKHFMSQIHSQCLRLERLIADMMQLARAQAGRAHLTITRVDVAEVIAESLKSYRPVAEAKEIHLEFCDQGAGLVMSDREATLTIANNLIGNAIRYTSAGGHVRVSFRDAGRFLALVVKDDGVGIPPNEQKRIFERFYRVQKSRLTRDDGTGGMTEGTGIGLSIVKNLTMALGGELGLTSHPGEGACFEVLLPKASTIRQSA